MNFTAFSYEDEIFQNISWINSDLNGKDFSWCKFKKCDFSGSDFSSSTFSDCEFSDCNLSNIWVNMTSFQWVKFDNCKLIWVIFSKINTLLISWSFTNCKIELSDFSRLDIKWSSFSNCIIRESDFEDANLSWVDFWNSDLQATKFQNSNLSKANFVWAQNYYIDPTSNILKKAKFSQPEVLSLLAWLDIEII